MQSLDRERIDEDISVHIFSVSAGLVGVCLTVIGILRIVIVTKNIVTLADDILSLDALLFLAACGLSFAALRMRTTRRMRHLEHAADVVFIVALVMMAAACITITYAVL